ncbi:hypothetical protein RchiOBHm_Chr6g0270601 [Rosa chinensis]|uniref:Uncharacterized protein n=1 Tax=Rosa chinensis TaxID=74649 RepID=A0A2P6PQS1_ROSCH|nr:hypothetical protein RchiOBHm_Chr6g0270601 [Rosa chinensis]
MSRNEEIKLSWSNQETLRKGGKLTNEVSNVTMKKKWKNEVLWRWKVTRLE